MTGLKEFVGCWKDSAGPSNRRVPVHANRPLWKFLDVG